MRKVFLTLAIVAVTALTAMAPSVAEAGEVAILGPTVTGGASSYEALYEIGEGHNVTVIPAYNWQTMSVAEFAAYDMLVLGDPTCRTGDSYIAAAAANPSWAEAVDGNVIIIGADPIYHITYGNTAGAHTLVQQGLDFAMADVGTGTTGAYITLSCYYHYSSANTPVPALSGFGTFSVIGAGTSGALNDVRIVASHPALGTLSDADLSNWYNSVHESFGMVSNSWPSDFEVLALAAGSGGNFTAPDGTVGYPYILARGVIPDFCGDGDLDPAEECDDGNNDDGDGCDAACNIESCIDSDGDGICDPDDICEGDDLSGDTDSDGICDDLDACPIDPDNDADGDGFCADEDNCPLIDNSDQTDTDGDGDGNACDNDDDDDGISDGSDNCPLTANPDQSDFDGDGFGDACDEDADGDGVNDGEDDCLNTPLGEITDSTGCSLSQYCPCEGNWRNHGGYVSCNAHMSELFVEQGLMTEAEKDAWMSTCGPNDCGKRNR
ncbi:thrombospondin type 3 repeat-containing protein [Patescibacteria group bacterium]